MEVRELSKDNFDLVKNNGGKALVEFYATWCAPCRRMASVVDELAEELTDTVIGKVDVDENRSLATEYRIMSVPTVIIFEDGKEISRSAGVVKKKDLSDMLL